MKERLSPETFRLPIEKIRAGYKSDVYFNRTKEILRKDNHNPQVTMQVFQKYEGAIVCGVDHALAILKVGIGHYSNPEKAQELFEKYRELEDRAYRKWLIKARLSWEEYIQTGKNIFEVSQELDRLWVSTIGNIKVSALYDGDKVASRETVMFIDGPYQEFAHLETLYLGALTDGTMVATNARRVVEAAGDTPVLMFGARHKAPEGQAGDGYAAYIGGAKGVSTDEQGEYWGSIGQGTMPHGFIAANKGDTVIATEKFDKYINDDPNKKRVNVISLVDFDNDCVGTSLAVANRLGKNLYAVRLDTSETMTDKSIQEELDRGVYLQEQDRHGVSPELVRLVRKALDEAGHQHVRIAVSGGFTPEKITRFKNLKIPVDLFGVGSAFYLNPTKFEYTADIVKPVGKKGRPYRPNDRLEVVKFT